MGYIGRHWRGELSLGVAYWVNLALLNVIFGFLVRLIDNTEELPMHPVKYSQLVFSFLTFTMFILPIWQIVGTWRTAARGIDGVMTGWGKFVQFLIVFGTLSLAGTIMETMPIYKELFHLAFTYKSDGFQDYKVTLTDNKSFIHVTGTLGFGVAEKFEEVLEKRSGIKGVILDSRGGRGYEGRELARIIKREGLDTYSLKGCHSACAIAFIAGGKRYLGPEANIGFHQHGGLQSTPEETKQLQEEYLRFFEQANVNENIIKRIFLTAHEDMWYPTINQMRDGNIIHGIVNPSDLIPIKLSEGLEEAEKVIENVLNNIPLIKTIKKYDLKTYNKVIQAVHAQVKKGTYAVEIQTAMSVALEEYAIKKMPKASNDTIISFIENFVRILEKANNKDPFICMKMLYPEEYGKTLYSQVVSRQDLKESNKVLNQIIIDFYELKEIPQNIKLFETTVAHLEAKAPSLFNEMDSDKELGNLQNQEDYRAHCKEITRFYTLILQEDKEAAGNALRYLSSTL